MTRLRFALLVNDKALRRWHLRCLSELEKTADLIGVIPIEAEHCRSGGRSSVLMRFFVRPGGEAGSVETASRLDDVPRQRNDKPLTDGSLHFVLKLGCGSVPDEVERTAPYGIWYFPHE